MKLSILIPTLKERSAVLSKLLDTIYSQIAFGGQRGNVQVLLDDRDKSVPTGTKRNELIQKATGEYIVFIDDDDKITATYITDIIEALEKNPDVVTFNGYMTTNGGNPKPFVIRLGEGYEERGSTYYRYPNHLCPMKKSLIQGVKFPDKTYGEDFAWATKIRDMGLLKKEIVIDKSMYIYQFRTNK